MGEVINMSEYLERKAASFDPHQAQLRMAAIAVEIALLQSEYDRIESVLSNDSIELT